MPILNASLAAIRDVSVGNNVPGNEFASPETPGRNGDGSLWQSRGYLGDYPLERGGWNSGFTQQTQPWYVIADPKDGNPARELVYYQFRFPRCYLRRRSDKRFILLPDVGSTTHLSNQHRLQNNVNEPTDDENPPIVGQATSGGVYLRKIPTYVIHGYPTNRLGMSSAIFNTYDALAVTGQFRCVPRTLEGAATNGFAWANSKAQVNIGGDNYNADSGLYGEYGHSRFTQITNRWQLIGMMGIKHPSITQPGGIEYADFMNSIFPFETLEEEIWLEKGAYDSGPDTQQLVLKRSAPVSTNKVYALSLKAGEITSVPAAVIMAAGSSSVQFQVTTPGSPSSNQQVLYITDGSTEDHWGDFVIGNGTSTGDSGGGSPGNPSGDYSRTNLLLESDDVRETPEWDLQGGSSNAPDGGGWQTIANGTGEMRQTVAGFTAGEPSTFTVELDPDSTDWVLLRISDDTYAVGGCHQFVNVSTGELGAGTMYGAATGLSCKVEHPIPGGSGGVRVALTLTLPSTSRIAMARAASANQAWDQEPGHTFQARYWQFQTGTKGTHHIPTDGTAVTRTLDDATITGTASTPVGPALTGTLTLLDDEGEPWDQFDDITVSSSNPAVVGVTQVAGPTNYLGQAVFQYTPLANGSANITAVAGDVTSNTFAVTVGGSAVVIDPPAAPAVSVLDSDTVLISVGSIDSDATYVAIDAALQNPAPGSPPVAYFPLVDVSKESFPLTITNFAPGGQYKFRARSRAGQVYSSYGPESSLVTLKRLMVEGYVATRALNQTRIRVQVFRPAPAGEYLPLGESLGSWTDQSFGGVAVIVNTPSGPVQQAPIRVQLTAHPASGKIRHGDRLSLIAVKPGTPSTMITSRPTDNAIVIEDF